MKCFAPWHSILVRFNGDLVPDGLYKNRYGNILTQELPDILNSPVAIATKQSIRQDILPSECEQCSKKEAVVGHSRRMFFKDILNPMINDIGINQYHNNFHDIRFLEFNMSNICNLKCRMCNGISSSAWVKEEIKLNQLNANYQRPVDHPEFGYQNISDKVVEKLFAYPEYFKNLKYLSIKGGEPYMEPANKKILERLINLGISKNITVDVTTNGTIVDEEFHRLAKEFGHTKWTVSVEGVGKLYDYIRGGKNHPFEELESNLKYFELFDRVIIAVTVMTYNISQLHKISDWYNTVRKNNYSIYFNNVVATPAYLNPSILPNDILARARDLNNIDSINYSQNKELAHLLPTFISFTRDLDQLRNTNVLEVCPELRSLFG
jgi:MoaA/NifB/PqqE/SkfB family radical SAM enzyme